MVIDLKQDSLRWRAEQQGHPSRGGSPHRRDPKGAKYPDKAAAPAYLDSQTHQSRQYYGPSATPAPGPVDSHYAAPTSAHSQRDPYGAVPVREAAGYPPGHAGYASSGYTQAAGSAYPSGQPAAYQEASYQSPASGYPSHAPTPSAYSSTSNYSASTQASYSSASPGYPAPSQSAGYVTSTTPQSYDSSNQPRSMYGTEGYAPPDSRTAADPYAAAYRTGQPQAQPGYGYAAGGAAAGRESVYQSSGRPSGSRYADTPSRNHLDIWLEDAKPSSMQYDGRVL